MDNDGPCREATLDELKIQLFAVKETYDWKLGLCNKSLVALRAEKRNLRIRLDAAKARAETAEAVADELLAGIDAFQCGLHDEDEPIIAADVQDFRDWAVVQLDEAAARAAEEKT